MFLRSVSDMEATETSLSSSAEANFGDAGIGGDMDLSEVSELTISANEQKDNTHRSLFPADPLDRDGDGGNVDA